ncbi:MAG: ABC transporter ATP-binding protein [Micrococcales bacterium]|nr:ABC transporter ATP-binding protein [Micrococcales bacterium]
MRDFPERHSAYLSMRADARPDTRSPAAFLRWIVLSQRDVLGAALVVATAWMVPQTLGPWLLGKTIDAGIVPGDHAATTHWIAWLAVVTIVGAACGVLFHTLVVRSWLLALYGTTHLITNKTLQLGHVLPQRTPTGEVLSVSGSDGDQFGSFLEILIRAASQFVAYLVVAAIVLSTSMPLGLLLLLGAPLLVFAATPLLRPLERWQRIERSRNSDLTSQATDIVAGLRILRGVGGEATFGDNYARQSQRVRHAGVVAGVWQAVIDAVGVLLSGVLLVGLMYLGVREVAHGRLTIGQLIAFLGYGLFLVQPMRSFFELAHKTTRALVSARKTIAVLQQEPPWRAPDEPVRLDPTGDLVDEASGFCASGGRLTMLVCATTDDAAALADRLGRYLPGSTQEAVSEELPEELKGLAARAESSRRATARAERAVRDETVARRSWGVRLGDVDLSRADLGHLRETLLVSDTGAHLFAGTLQQAIDPHGALTREQAETALHAAAAEDVYDALPGGWQGVLEERARGLSGGQRQRLVLARALATDPPVLVLVEPTSAVDAHTEARIGVQLPVARRGRTTVVATTSPLLLRHADEVALVIAGRLVAAGTHEKLMSAQPRYRNIVLRDGESAQVQR